jgi:hypothetical protein
MTASALTALHLGNFKAFAHTQRIPLKPLTLIYGPNSSGKSSIIHSLVLARHAVETGELDTYSTSIGGEAVDLGGFGQYVYRRDRGNRVEWAIDLNARSFKEPLAELLKPVETLTVRLTIGCRDDRVRVESFSIDADQGEVIYMSARRQGDLLRCDRLNFEHPILRPVLDAAIESQVGKKALDDTDRAIVEAALNALAPEIMVNISHWLPQEGINFGDEDEADEATSPQWQRISSMLMSGLAATGAGVAALSKRYRWSSAATLLAGAALLPINPGNRKADPATVAQYSQIWVLRRLNDLLMGLSEAIEANLKSLRYLGPFRSYPPRHFGSARQRDPNWEAGGGAAWQTLLTNPTVRDKVNFWLGDKTRMQTPYQLVVRDLLPTSELAVELLPLLNQGFQQFAAKLIAHASGLGSEVQSELERLMGDIEAFSTPDSPDGGLPELEELVSILEDTDLISEAWTEKLATASSERSADLVLVDQRSQTPVSHRDVGIGVSQVLPILVSSYALTGTLVAVEQPELHLHPRLQSDLADVFIESALGETKNTFLLETHSEHLLLRIMRRMRETYEGRLPEGALPVHPEDVAVIYVDPSGPQSIVQELPLNKRGELVKAWPGGFFEEGLEEVFA